MTTPTLIPCPGCGALFPESDGPTHAYLGASAGCWAVYGDILAKEYSEYGYPGVHRLTVDAYAVQHPGTPSRRTIQSVAVHLISLHCVLEHGMDAKAATEALKRAVAKAKQFEWLTPPAPNGTLTVRDVAVTRSLEDHAARVEAWARDVWRAWETHHAIVRAWARLGGS